MSQPINMPDVLLQTPAGGFIVGVNKVGDLLELPVERYWIPVKSAGLASIAIRRGHPNKGLSGYGPGTATITFVDRDGSYDYSNNPLAVPGTPVKVVEPTTLEPIFTGAIADLTFDYRPDSGETVLTVNCVDSMATLENHTLYGMKPPSGYPWLPGSETFESRIQRIADRTPVRFAAIPGRPGALEGLELEGFTGVNQTPHPLDIGFDSTSHTGFTGYVKTTPTTGVGALGGLVGWECSIAGLVINRYILQADVIRPAGSGGLWYGEVHAADGVTGHSTISTWDPPENGWQRGLIQFEFTGHWNPDTCRLRFMADGSRTAHPSTITSLTVENLTIHPANSSGLFLSATVYETSAAQHLTMAADTVGGFWYVSRRSEACVTWGESPEDPADYVFTDFGDGIKYGDLLTTYSTADIVNRLAITNHSIYPDGSAIDPGLANDTSHAGVDAASVVKNLPREMSLDLNIFAPTLNELEELVARRSTEIFETRATIQYLPASLRFRGHDYPEKASKLDLTQISTIETGSQTHPARVVGIDHDITPYEWLVTIELEPVRTL